MSNEGIPNVHNIHRRGKKGIRLESRVATYLPRYLALVLVVCLTLIEKTMDLYCLRNMDLLGAFGREPESGGPMHDVLIVSVAAFD